MNYRKLEILAVLLTGCLKFVMIDWLGAKFWFIMMAGGYWLSYVAYQIQQHPMVIKDWGIGFKGFLPSLKILTIPTIAILGFGVWYGHSQGILIFNWHIIPVLILYPLWGTIQQLLILTLFGANIRELKNFSPYQINVLTSVLFSIVHYPNLPLMAATFLLAYIYCMLYFKYHNILILGIFHGWLAAIFYFFVLGRDPWIEFIGSI